MKYYMFYFDYDKELPSIKEFDVPDITDIPEGSYPVNQDYMVLGSKEMAQFYESIKGIVEKDVKKSKFEFADEVKQLVSTDQKISAIHLVRDRIGLGLASSRKIVEDIINGE